MTLPKEQVCRIDYEITDNLGKAASALSEQEADDISRLIEEALKDRNEGEYTGEQIFALTSALDKNYFQTVEPNSYQVLAKDKGTLIGAGRLVRREQWEIKTLYVKPSYQGKGIGSKIMDALEERAKQRGITMLRLGAEIFPRTIKFYERRGYSYSTVGVLEVPGLNGQMLRFIAMEKQL